MDLIDKLRKKYQRKKVLVVGLGLQGGGVGVAKFFAELGAKVIVNDKKDEKQLFSSIEKLKNLPITFHLGGHHLDDFLCADVIFKGPGVQWDLPEIIEAQKKDISIEMEMSFVASLFPGKIIGITGTRGKSTTTNLIYEVLKQSGFNVFLGGGLPGISNIEFLKKADENTYLVAELSSWALSGFHRKKISPHIGVFTNFYPDHLNYYKSMDDYLYDKKAIFMYQKKEDYLIVNKTLQNVIDSAKQILSHESLISASRGPLESEKIAFASSIKYFSKEDFPYELKYLKGDHNLENAAAALKVAEILKIDLNKAINIICNFKGVPYRQQVIKEKEGIIFVNDTTSTTPTATIKAIEAFKDKKIVLILGGNSKNLPIDDLIKNLNKVEKIILLAGSFTDEILDTLKVLFMPKKISKKIYNNLEEAVIEAYRIAKEIKSKESQVCILFSPGATSFAMFNNEFHRGDEFNRIVKKIII